MANKTINVRIDEETKKEAEELFEDLGMNTSTAIKMFLKQSLRERALPFQPSMNDVSYEAKREAEEDDLPEFSSVENLMDYLNDED